MGGGCCIANCCIGDCCVGEIIGDIIRSGVDKLKSTFCSDSCCVGYSSVQNKTESHATKIANELAAKKAEKHANWDKTEKALVDSINVKMSTLLDELEKLNAREFAGKSLDIDVKGIRAKVDEMKKDVVGHVGRVFEERLVLTDKELSVILQEKSDKKRKASLDAFCKRVQKTAILGLKSKIRDSIKAQNNLIVKTITTRLEEVNESMRQEKKDYDEMLNAKEKREKEAEIQIQHAYVQELAALLERLSSNDKLSISSNKQ